MTWLLVAVVVVLMPLPGLPHRWDLGPEPMATAGGQVPVRLNHVGAAAAAIAALVMVPLPWSIPLAALAGGASFRLLPTGFTRDGDRQALAMAKALPDAVDLLAAVLRAGLPDSEGLMVVAVATNEPLASHLSLVARHRRLGAGPGQAWRQVAHVPQLGDLAAAMARHADTGSPIAPVLDRVAADARRDYFSQAQQAARAAAVRAVIPLAACFLPAFLTLGVVPIVASLLSGLSF